MKQNPGERISRSMYHEAKSWRTNFSEYVSWRKSWDIINSFLLFFVFFQKKTGARCMYHETKISKNPGKIVSRTIPQDFPSPLFFFWKNWQRRKKTWSTNPLEHESPWSLEHESPGARMPLEYGARIPWRTNPPGPQISLALEWAIFFFYHHFFEPAHLPRVWMDVKTIESPQLICIIPIDCRQHLFWTKW